MIKYLNQPLVKNYVSLLLVQGGNFIFPLLVFPLVGRNIGVSEFGNILFCYMVAFYFSIFVDYGFNFSAVRRVSKMENHHGIGESFYGITFSKVILAACALAAMTLMTLGWEKLSQLSGYMVLSALLIVASMLSPYWLLQGVGKTAAGALITLFARIATLAIFLCFPITPYSAVLLLVFPNFLAALIMLLWVFRRYRIGLPRFSPSEITANLREGWPVFVANSITMVYAASNTILLGIISGPLAAGLYGAAERLVRSGLAVMAPLCQAAYPIICSYRAEQIAKRNKIIKLVLAASFVFGIGAFLVLNLFSTPIITLLFGEAFIAAAPILAVLSVMLLIIPPAIVLAQLYLLANSHDKVLQRIYIFCSATHCLHIYFLTKFFGAMGASYSLIFTELLATLLIVYMSMRIFKREKLISCAS
ncbi:Putative O-antigen transporter [Serratia entomophila]|uniref:oligosaccharide flippase family protein n=1 Tax=Serratia entomophila TaxID=42906 RepID=UPI00217BEA41|nr:oligosaccharide flippase family protein [Serratia entomophila]CAI0881214.1 Putative O-antigen transporter [Serratia entomophila]CAI1518714.1 Putative O-antigen transporter [Serratia entomophila]